MNQDPPASFGHSTRRGFLKGSSALTALSVLPATLREAAAEPPPEAGADYDNVYYADVRLTINGQPVNRKIDTRTTVLDLLREELDLTGTKKGCNHGACGACTVHLNGKNVNACLQMAVLCDGQEITTIEGLADGDTLHPVQAAFIEHDGFQCGYCTSGQIMSAVAVINDGHATEPAEIRELMSGNLCRCGAYNGIIDAIQDVQNRGIEGRKD